jgi:hypothetical protein
MLNGYKIIDADTHTIEPVDIWRKYLNPSFQEFAPSPDLKIKGENIYHKIPNRFSNKVSLVNKLDSEFQVRAMQQMGIDLSLDLLENCFCRIIESCRFYVFLFGVLCAR